MIRSFAVTLVCFLAVAALGQTTTTTTDPQSQTPTENLAQAAAHGPASWVTAARQRHQAFIEARVTNPRQGELAGTGDGLEPNPATGTVGTGGLGGLGDLGGLLDLVGGAGGISDLLGGFSGGTGPAGTGGMTIQDLLALRDQLLGESGGSSTSGTSATSGKSGADNGKTAARSMELRGGSGAIGRLPKIDDRSATTPTALADTTTTGTTQQPKFMARLATGLADAFFGAVSFGFQSDAFVSYVKAWMRPMFFPQEYGGSESADDDTDETDSDSDSGSII